MGWNTVLYFHYATRAFTPIVSFMTPFLIEKKKFTNRDIYDKITPCFFISSLFTPLLAPFIADYIGNKGGTIFETFIELMVYIIFFLMPPKNIRIGMLTGVMHGATSAMASIFKGIILEIMPNHKNRSEVLADQALIKRVSSVAASWIGQDINFSTGDNTCNLYISFFMMLSSFILSIFIPTPKGNSIKEKSLIEIFLSGWEETCSKFYTIYSKPILIFSILNIISSSLYIAFAIYSSNIFIERKKEVDISVNRLGKILYYISAPTRFLSGLLVRFISIFDKSVVYCPEYKKNIIIYGYIDGIAKIVTGIIGYAIGKHTYDYHIHLTITTIVIIFLIIFTFFLRHVKSLISTYCLYLLASTASMTALIISKNGFSCKKGDIAILNSVNIFFSSLIHIFISYYTKWRGVNAEGKLFYYIFINICLLALVLLLNFIW
ncbi:hypothetical protein TCON_2437 [Astathelohania contejeani]|uniref:Uncharacterized protein n=1 Tax=Astathelohania contejeani TaxID=164912 RepID=A0ABQ7HW19_9MICR|nr:hypothetical protein TCON_2437 [Thelohania contejeani]